MRILHLADLHIGKRVNGFNMIEDQRYALEQIILLIKREAVDTVLIAGDVYDQTVPSSEAILLFDSFITELHILEKKVIIISGNHDSQERLGFARDLIQQTGIYISKKFDSDVEKVVLNDKFGPVNFYLLPFIKPIFVKQKYPDLSLDDFQGALSSIISDIEIDKSQRNVILSHQFIVGAETSESEELYIGGLEGVSLDIYSDFDYVALGHIHKKQSFKNGLVRYPGSLLKYSKSECNYNKNLTIIELKDKGVVDIEEHEIEYLRDMREINGYFSDIVEASYQDQNPKDYVHLNLFDEDEIFDAINRLRELYPNIMSIKYVNQKSTNMEEMNYEIVKSKDPFELFNDFYEYRNNKKLDENKSKLIKRFIDEIWGDI